MEIMESALRPSSMRLRDRIQQSYREIHNDSAIVTAADSKYSPYLLNMLSSLHTKSPEHPNVFVFDIGLDKWQQRELTSIPWVKLRKVEPFVDHWKLNWTWKLYVMSQVERRYVLYMDPNFVVLRPLLSLLLAIKRNGYVAVSALQMLWQITPTDYWDLVGISQRKNYLAEVFGAGFFGYDRRHPSNSAVLEALELAKAGWTLGCSAGETRPTYDRSVIRDCECFRCDQTLLNLTLRKWVPEEILVRRPLHYYGNSGQPSESPRQLLWYARRAPKSMTYYGRPIGTDLKAFVVNRLASAPTLTLRWLKWELLPKSFAVRLNSVSKLVR